MEYREARLGGPLDRWIECVWTARAEARPGTGFESIVPDGCPELIVQLGDGFEAAGPRGAEAQPRSLLVGPLTGPLRLRARGRVHTVGVRFRPGGLARFLRCPQHELADRAVPLRDLFGAPAAELVERLGEARDPGALAAAVAALLAPRPRPRPTEAVRTRAIVQELIRSRGRVGIEALARGAGVSARQLERVFRREVGLSPKRLARVVRLQDVIRRLAERPARWVDIALDCGYADQAHLAREFRELAGEAPSRWLGGDGQELARQFTTPARLDAFFSG
ncbi:MAG TPA: helix-turn-helix transcriptional regulator [Vicinamibacteria bacterium]